MRNALNDAPSAQIRRHTESEFCFCGAPVARQRDVHDGMCAAHRRMVAKFWQERRPVVREPEPTPEREKPKPKREPAKRRTSPRMNTLERKLQAKGWTYRTLQKHYMAQVRVWNAEQGRSDMIYLGVYQSPEEARAAYVAACHHYFGEQKEAA